MTVNLSGSGGFAAAGQAALSLQGLVIDGSAGLSGDAVHASGGSSLSVRDGTLRNIDLDCPILLESVRYASFRNVRLESLSGINGVLVCDAGGLLDLQGVSSCVRAPDDS